jgi:large subunit ribosomal protein L15
MFRRRIHGQVAQMTRLNELRDNEGSYKTRVRIGRGIGSGKGKTGGRGGKGQTARSGVAINGFEGGQMPLHMRMPKRGFNVPNAKRYNAVRLDRIQAAIDSGKLDVKGVVDAAALVAAGVIRRARDGVRLIAGANEFKAKKVSFKVDHASAGAVAAIEAAGGKVDMPEAKAKAEA